MRPDLGSHRQPSGALDNAPTNRATRPGLIAHFKCLDGLIDFQKHCFYCNDDAVLFSQIKIMKTKPKAPHFHFVLSIQLHHQILFCVLNISGQCKCSAFCEEEEEASIFSLMSVG